MSSESTSAEEMFGFHCRIVQPLSAVCYWPTSRAGWVADARARVAGGMSVLSSGRSPNPSAVNAGRQPFCPCLHPSCLADVSERLWDGM